MHRTKDIEMDKNIPSFSKMLKIARFKTNKKLDRVINSLGTGESLLGKRSEHLNKGMVDEMIYLIARRRTETSGSGICPPIHAPHLNNGEWNYLARKGQYVGILKNIYTILTNSNLNETQINSRIGIITDKARGFMNTQTPRYWA